MNYQNPDLTQHPPRSARVRLGGYAILPRALDKCRAELAGKSGGYHYACPLDQRFFQFAGIDADQLKAEVAKGLSDSEILAWIQANSTRKAGPWEIDQWTAYVDQYGPADNGTREYFNGLVASGGGTEREDIRGFFDLLDVDDFTSFGGKA